MQNIDVFKGSAAIGYTASIVFHVLYGLQTAPGTPHTVSRNLRATHTLAFFKNANGINFMAHQEIKKREHKTS